MKQVYQTEDGKIFKNKEMAIRHEKIKKIKFFMVKHEPDLNDGSDGFGKSYFIGVKYTDRIRHTFVLLLTDYLNKRHGLLNYVQGCCPVPGYSFKAMGQIDEECLILEYKNNEAGLIEVNNDKTNQRS